MEKWQIALDKFLRNWKNKPYVLGALVTGSYTIDRQTQNSDVDVHIILSNKVKWRDRGDKKVDDVLVEYFANPVNQLKLYMINDHKTNSKSCARMFSIGNIIFDKTGDVVRLKRYAEKQMKKRFKKVDKEWTISSKYHIWDEFDGLEDSYKRKSNDFELLYFQFLKYAIDVYCIFLGTEKLPLSKLYRLFSDVSYRNAYQYEEFPDKVFTGMILQSIDSKTYDGRIESARKLMDYVHNKMGGFDINNIHLKSKISLK